MKFSLLTYNVQFYNDASPTKISNALEKIDADVILTQEDIFQNSMNIKGYKRISQCQAEIFDSFNGDKLSNSIYLRSTINYKDIPSITFFPQQISDTPRCITLCEIEGMVVANVHLTGGRFEDPQFKNLIDDKVNIMKELITKYKPDIIAGDLNGEPKPSESFIKHIKERIDVTLENLCEYWCYYACVHSYLVKKGYRPAYTMKEIGATSSRFGTTPDWVYHRPGLKVTQVKNLQSLGKLSDHTGVLVTFE